MRVCGNAHKVKMGECIVSFTIENNLIIPSKFEDQHSLCLWNFIPRYTIHKHANNSKTLQNQMMESMENKGSSYMLLFFKYKCIELL